jgi:TRAP-type transport system periplasmic protein
MRVGRRTFVVSMLATLGAPAVLRLARADAPITLKLHHAMSSVSSGHDKFLAPWARKIESDSGGRIRIDIFPSMQLGGAPAALFDQARDGVADITLAVPALTPGRFPRIETFELPFLASSRALVSSKALQDFAAANLKDEFAEVYPLCFSCSDRAVVHANQPVRTIEDIKGLKLHVQTRFGGEAVRVLGANPVPMPSGQLPIAITEHVVDGCVDPWHLVPTLRLNDLLKAHTEFSDSSLSSRTFVLAMNTASYDRLPRDLKTVIDNNSGQFVAGMAGAMWDVQAQAVADMVVERGDVIVTLLPEAVAHWRKGTEPVVDAWLKDMKEQKIDGGKLIAGARALLAKYANLPEPGPPQPPPSPENQAGAQPQPHLEAKGDVSAAPKVSAPAATPPASSSSAPPSARAPAPAQASAPAASVKPAPSPAPHVATGAPAPAAAPAAGAAPVPAAPAAPAPPAATVTPVAKPVSAPVPALVPAPVAVPTASAAPPAPLPVPPKPPVVPPKMLDIPL